VVTRHGQRLPIHAVEKESTLAVSLVAFGAPVPCMPTRWPKKLRLETIIVPPGGAYAPPSGFSWLPCSFDLGQSYVSRLEEIPWERLNSIYGELEAKAASFFWTPGWPRRTCSSSARGMRYAGQG